MMNRTLPALALSLLLLAGCNSKPTTIVGDDHEDPTAREVAAAPPVKLPPMMTSDKSYRCKDNSLVYISFFNDDITAAVRTAKDAKPIQLLAPKGGEPYVGAGWTLTGTKDKTSLTVQGPGKAAQTCTSGN